ncbi:MAG: M1 family metallopeptidase [Chitinophagaceae bacterium]
MARFVLIISFILFCSTNLKSQQIYWQQEVHYSIDVTLNDRKNTLSGKLTLDYINHSPDTLYFLWFHIWPNAYKNTETALYKQLSKDDESKRKLKKAAPGYLDSLSFTINSQPATFEYDPLYIDIIKLQLPQPLLPNQQIIIKSPFFVKLPSYYSRSGYDGQQYMICQWYPKPAVYDRKGWHAFPYLDQGEFYSEYGSFQVTITLPEEYVVGATGTLQNKVESDLYKSIGYNNFTNREKGPAQFYRTKNPGKTKSLLFKADRVHDFAWFADKNFIIQYDTIQLPSGKITEAFTYSQPKGNDAWKNSLRFVKDATKSYSSWLGEYPYPVVQAVEGPKNQSSGGMEYPMITLITSPGADDENLDAVITHEVGHNWFYSILGTNERENPWMDEGLNTYYQFRYEATKYHGNTLFGKNIPKELRLLSVTDLLDRIYSMLKTIPAKDPISTSSTGFANKDDYSFVVYVKTAIWFFIAETALGKEELDKGMKAYFEKWKFKHPYPEDFKEALETATGKNLDDLFALLNKEGSLE